MKERKFDSSGVTPYISDKETILRVVSHLSGVSTQQVKSLEKKAGTRAREIAVLLMNEDLGITYEEIGRYLGHTEKGVQKQRIRGARRLRSDEEFAHTFSVAEQRSNTHTK